MSQPHHPYRLATYKFSLTLPKPPDGPDSPVEFAFARQVNLFHDDEALKREARLEFNRWCEKHLQVDVETKLIGKLEDVAKHYAQQAEKAAHEAATVLYLSDSSDYECALRNILKLIAPHTLTALDEGKFRPYPEEDEETEPDE